MTVGELLGGGFRVLTRRPKELIIWTLIQLAVGALVFIGFRQWIASILPRPGGVPELGAASMISLGASLVLFYLFFVLWLLMLFSAVVRATANPGEDKFAWLRFGGDELRLIGLGLLYVVGMIVVSIVFGIAIALVATIIAGGNAENLGALGIILRIGLFCAYVWLFVRLSLMGPVFVLEKNFALRKGWQATKGHFWTLFLTYLVMGIAFVIFEFLVILLLSPVLFSNMFSGAAGDPAQAFEQQRQLMTALTSPGIGMIVVWIIGTLFGTAAIVYYYGVTATAAVSATGYSKQDLEELGSHFE